MHFRLLGLSLLLSTSFAWSAPGRAPAVEDFVGIEVEQVEGTPGNESLYNLEQDVGRIQKADGKKEASSRPQGSKVKTSEKVPWDLSTFLGVLFIMGLPLVSWMFVLNHLKNKASAESASNIEVLEKYRQEREAARTKSEQDDVKKAS